MYPVKIDGDRVYLREFEGSDLSGTMRIVGDSQVTAFLSFDTRSRAEQAERLAADVARARSDPRPDYYLAVIEKDSEDLVGFCRLGLGGHRSGELGYALQADRWGKGYAVAAATAMLNFGFDSLQLHRIQAACGPDNLASRRVLEKLGFVQEGRIRDHVFTNGSWRDSLLSSILQHEWAG